MKMAKYGRFVGNEKFIINGNPTEATIVSFWSWDYSELDSNIVRSVLAEYIVATALGITKEPGEEYRQMWRPYDLMYQGIRIEVKSASTIQTWETRHKGKHTFSIAPAKVPNEYGDYADDAPVQRNSDIYIFCLFEPDDENTSPLNLNAWRFLVLPTHILNDMSLTQKTIGISSLMKLNPVECKYEKLKAIVDQCKR